MFNYSTNSNFFICFSCLLGKGSAKLNGGLWHCGWVYNGGRGDMMLALQSDNGLGVLNLNPESSNNAQSTNSGWQLE